MIACAIANEAVRKQGGVVNPVCAWCRWLPRDVAAGQVHKVVQIEGPITATVKAVRAVCAQLRAWQVGVHVFLWIPLTARLLPADSKYTGEHWHLERH